MPRRYDKWDYFPPPSVPIPAQGGIKLQGTARDQSWWAQRWIAVLESFNIGTRLARGRSYARNGQVLDIAIAPGRVTAQVQGSRPQPYRVTIDMPTLSVAEWESVLDAIAAQAAFTAQLLNGAMPQAIETAFAAANVALFPQTLQEIETFCSCPDWSNPCKHIAAVYYLLGQEFDRDPFLIFTLRGLTREDLLDHLGTRADASPSDTPPPEAEPLPDDPQRFWHGDPAVPIAFASGAPPPVTAPLLRQLGPFPFWRGETDLRQTLEPLYRVAALRATALHVATPE